MPREKFNIKFDQNETVEQLIKRIEVEVGKNFNGATVRKKEPHIVLQIAGTRLTSESFDYTLLDWEIEVDTE